MRILIVDDEMALVETMVERLAIRGIEAQGFSTGREAVEAIANQPFDVVLLDVKMPEMSGLQVLRKIRDINPKQKVILLTGHGSRDDADEGIRLGALDYLMKPVNIEDLIGILKQASNQRGDS
ncbi:MAG: response regulator [Myxococcota bacterium]|nr:response regulator [Myxococcota bacterium]